MAIWLQIISLREIEILIVKKGVSLSNSAANCKR